MICPEQDNQIDDQDTPVVPTGVFWFYEGAL